MRVKWLRTAAVVSRNRTIGILPYHHAARAHFGRRRREAPGLRSGAPEQVGVARRFFAVADGGRVDAGVAGRVGGQGAVGATVEVAWRA